MRAVGVTRYGGPEALELVVLPDPEPGPGEVRVRVLAAAVNPADVMLRDGSLASWYADVVPPFIPGMDIAGTIDQVGADVDPSLGLQVGHLVVGVVDNHGQYGGYSELLALPAESVTPAPAGESPAEAASFLMPALTARTALDTLALPSGSSLLIAGAAGGVGRYAVALAHADELRVIAVASAEDADDLRRLGADDVIDRDQDVPASARRLIPAGVDAVLDTTTRPELFVDAVRDGGMFLSPRGADIPSVRGITLLGVNVREHMRDHAALSRLREQAETGLLPLDVAAEYPAENATEAHRRFDAGHLRGRIILTFDPAA